jgi:tetratricopeptide (TPR) repeat protein
MGDPITTRPAPAASGTLAKTPFVHLLLYALERKLTGTVDLFAPDKRSAAVLFIAGQPTKIRTSEAVAHLGGVLADLGYITREELERSLAELVKAKGMRPTLHGELLLGKGMIDSGKLSTGLREQLARKLHHVGAMPGETAYAYYEGFDALRGWGGESEGVDPVPLLWGMLREYAPWDHVNTALARVRSSPLRLARNATLQGLGLKADEIAAAELLRVRPLCVSDLPGSARLNERTAQLLAYLLLITKNVEVLAPVQPAPGSPPVPSAPTSAPPRTTSSAKLATSAPPVPPPTLSRELTDRWHEIVDRAATIDRADYFMMLDVHRGAKRDEIETAFIALVKRWHPDRLPPELTAVRDACSRVFGRMSEAHATLTDDEQRARYMRLLADGSGSPETQATVAKVVEAATNFQKAEVCFRRNDLDQAEIFCRKALEDDPTQPDYHALLAWLIALKPASQTPEKTVDCIQRLDRAIDMNDRCEKAYFWRGMLYKRLGKNDLAVKDFKRATDLNHRNIDAAREVRLYLMRGGRRSSNPPGRSMTPPPKNDDAPKPGLLGRLFKKT